MSRTICVNKGTHERLEALYGRQYPRSRAVEMLLNEVEAKENDDDISCKDKDAQRCAARTS